MSRRSPQAGGPRQIQYWKKPSPPVGKASPLKAKLKPGPGKGK